MMDLRSFGIFGSLNGLSGQTLRRYFHTLRRYFHTLRHLKPVQVVGRVWPEVKKRAARRGLVLTRVPDPPPGALAGRLEPATPFLGHAPWSTRADVLGGRFQFLNHAEALGRPVEWSAVEDLPLLWQYNLHYFHYLALLDPAEQQALCREWMRANPVGQTVGWRAYPLSLRIVNWCKAGLDAPDLQASLYRQAAYLYRNTERYLQGNHWLENAKALVFAGRFFGGRGESGNWLRHGLRVLRRETPRQVLPDGGYFERSPMYHALMLEGYLDLVNVLPNCHRDAALFRDTAARMSDFLVSVTHPDGHVALFNDATQETAPSTQQLASYAEQLLDRAPQKRDAFPDAGYFVCETDDCWLIVDGGPLGPNFLPAHAHADIFSFELSAGGVPFIVDSGTHDYEAGPLRAHLRGTAAHNTVCVDGVDQVECWKSHRVARRSEPLDVLVRRDGKRWQFSGRFDGYRKLIGDGIVHRRRITCEPASAEGAQRVLRVEDRVAGRGTHHVASRLHLHPGVSVKRQGERRVMLERAGVRCCVEARAHPIRLEQGWYCPRFGVKRATRVPVVEARTKLPTTLQYELRVLNFA